MIDGNVILYYFNKSHFHNIFFKIKKYFKRAHVSEHIESYPREASHVDSSSVARLTDNVPTTYAKANSLLSAMAGLNEAYLPMVRGG